MRRIKTEHILLMKKHLAEKNGIVVEDIVKGNHPVLNIPNLDVMCFCKSLEGKGMAKKTHVWKHSFYTLTKEGIIKLREELSYDVVLSVNLEQTANLNEETAIIN
ncbi:hypothetical protein H311_03762 [Anncaliia algerae PRA109]|uniref:Plectin/eS10 N-terminal domain-containing protein n=2 Tax=Anncaliia algerae TaxID=723287 RepID=A0A059F2F8_9MICR|nr:hypothetical protein H311_03762 [Anncaliia algerae PRA109]KCZ81297.1 hypothetical protein H312_01293 [Anncaliia algerae PRA339]CBH28896.1 40S RIBOSOMAL PROTEIN S10 [Anncaliia algerae]